MKENFLSQAEVAALLKKKEAADETDLKETSHLLRRKLYLLNRKL